MGAENVCVCVCVCKYILGVWQDTYPMKLNFYFNELYAVITTCKLELHDSG